jgi:N,N'-diacetyllegionaminate synthase
MSALHFKIGKYRVGEDSPCLVIGEVGQAHDGSLGTAHAYIDAIASAGAQAVKFQTHIARAESSTLEPFRVKFSLQDATRFDYWKRMEFTTEQWAGLADHAREKDLLFLSSPFSEDAVDMLEKIGMPAWKVASGEVNNPLLLERILATHSPILLSTGMSPLAEVDRIVDQVKAQGVSLSVFQCTSKYPSSPQDVGLNMIQIYRERFQVPVGLSDHSGKIFPGLAAVTLGASILEVHVTLSRDTFGPDVPVSLTPIELKQLVEGVYFIEQAIHAPVNKDAIASDLASMRTIFGKSLVARRNLIKGHILERGDLSARKPGSGIPVERLDDMIGRVLTRDIDAGEFLEMTDFKNGR